MKRIGIICVLIGIYVLINVSISCFPIKQTQDNRTPRKFNSSDWKIIHLLLPFDGINNCDILTVANSLPIPPNYKYDQKDQEIRQLLQPVTLETDDIPYVFRVTDDGITEIAGILSDNSGRSRVFFGFVHPVE